MKTKSGVLYMNKTEKKAMETVLKHCEADLSFRGEGTFSKLDNENTFDEKEAKKAQEGIILIRWILETYAPNQ